MARAIELAQRGLYTTRPNPSIGCVIVNNEQIIGEGWTQRAGQAHAEAHALQSVADTSLTQGATAYVTLEPCCHHGRTPPCTDALLAAGIRRVVAAMTDPNPQVAGQGFAQLQASGVAVTEGVLTEQAKAINRGFFQRMAHRRPWIRIKLAMSLDGRTAMASGESQWITSCESRADVQLLRARSAAIMTGIGTVLADNPSLNVRLPDVDIVQPLRVILDPALQTPPAARTLSLSGQVLIFTSITNSLHYQTLQATGAEIVAIAGQIDSQQLDLNAVIAELSQREINEVHLECGATLAGAFLQAKLVDELVIYIAPKLLGDNARSLVHLPGLEKLADAVELTIIDAQAIGPDWRFTLQVTH